MAIRRLTQEETIKNVNHQIEENLKRVQIEITEGKVNIRFPNPKRSITGAIQKIQEKIDSK